MLVVKVWGEPVCEILYFNELKGLPSNHITRIIQDKQGAIWMATWNGLCLYDGYEFHTYKSNDALSTSDRFRNVVMEEDGNFVCAIDDDFSTSMWLVMCFLGLMGWRRSTPSRR